MGRHTCTVGFPSGSAVNNLPAVQETWVQPWIGKSSWRRRWRPISVFLPGKSCGQRNLVDCSPLGRKRAAHDLTTEHTLGLCCLKTAWNSSWIHETLFWGRMSQSPTLGNSREESFLFLNIPVCEQGSIIMLLVV